MMHGVSATDPTRGPGPVYRVVITVAAPLVRWWGRMEVTGLDALPQDGPVLLIGNHDSNMDPIAVGVAGHPHREIRALAKSTLWKSKPLGWILDQMGQVPIERGKGDRQAMDAAAQALASGSCIGVFPEGTISRGSKLRPRSGVGRLAEAVPEATVVSVATIGTVDIVRFPKRPRIRVEFFRPAGGGRQPEESAGDFAVRVVGEIRERAPHTIPGRAKTAAKYRAKVAAEEAEG
jgi:1-acyl-sn-glycerol-3-phosphate acyltransferase